MFLLREKQAQFSPDEELVRSQHQNHEQGADRSETTRIATANKVGTTREDLLSQIEREHLQAVLDDWRSPPEEWLLRPLPEEDRLKVIDALFRSVLVSQSRELAGQSPNVTRSHQIELVGGQSLVLYDSEWRGEYLLGRASWGETLTVPVQTIEQIQSIPKSVLGARQQAELQQRIERLLASQHFHERTEALLQLIQQGELRRATQELPNWYAKGGVHHLAEAATDPAKRELWRKWARELKVPLLQVPARQTPQPETLPSNRSLLTLEAFLSKNKKLRGLDEDGRATIAEQCTNWTDWLEKHPQALSIPAGRRASLGEELRLLRYDLLKAGGF